MKTKRRNYTKPNRGWANCQNERERSMFKIAGLPQMILRKPQATMEKGLALVEELKVLEAQITIWEDQQTDDFLSLLPWWEERKNYRKLKEEGNVPEVVWWQALAFFENVTPTLLTKSDYWGRKRKKTPKFGRLVEPSDTPLSSKQSAE